MSRKHRKNNNRRRFKRITEATVKNFILVSIAGVTNGMALYHINSLERLRPTRRLQQAIVTKPFDWCISIGVAARDQFGEQYITSLLVSHNSIFERAVDSLYVHHNELIAGTNPNHVLTGGWIASPRGVEISKEKEYELYEKLGTFEKLITPWEDRNSK